MQQSKQDGSRYIHIHTMILGKSSANFPQLEVDFLKGLGKPFWSGTVLPKKTSRMANITRGISGKGEFSYTLHGVCTMKSIESNRRNHDVDWNQECVMPFLLNIACIEDHDDYSYSPIFLGTLQTKTCTVLRYSTRLRDV